MSAKCCSKPNVTTYPDGSGICQSCRTEFAAGEAVAATSPDADLVAELMQRLAALEDSVSQISQLTRAANDAVASLDGRVLTLEGNVVQPS